MRDLTRRERIGDAEQPHSGILVCEDQLLGSG